MRKSLIKNAGNTSCGTQNMQKNELRDGGNKAKSIRWNT